MAATRVALVTGSNQGIGLEIVRGLCKQFNGHVYLTARDVTRGHQAVLQLQSEGLYPCFHQLDVTGPDSVERLKGHILKNYGGLDVLVNNAGIIESKMELDVPFTKDDERVLDCNFWSLLNLVRTFLPSMRDHGRIVNVTSEAGAKALASCSTKIQERFKNVKTVSDVEVLVKEFEDTSKAGTQKEHGWVGKTDICFGAAYGVSKLGVSALSKVLQAEIDKDASRPDLIANACCPGFVNSNLTTVPGYEEFNARGATPAEGAASPLYLALLPVGTHAPRGSFVSKKKEIAYEHLDEEFWTWMTAASEKLMKHHVH